MWGVSAKVDSEYGEYLMIRQDMENTSDAVDVRRSDIMPTHTRLLISAGSDCDNVDLLEHAPATRPGN